jgi:hypothetical protein
MGNFICCAVLNMYLSFAILRCLFAVIAAVSRCYFHWLRCQKTRISAALADLCRCFFAKEQRKQRSAGWLEERCASFEASLREAPQDEEFFLMPSTTYPHAEERLGVAGARLEARTALDAANSCPASTYTLLGIPYSRNCAERQRTAAGTPSAATISRNFWPNSVFVA